MTKLNILMMRCTVLKYTFLLVIFYVLLFLKPQIHDFWTFPQSVLYLKIRKKPTRASRHPTPTDHHSMSSKSYLTKKIKNMYFLLLPSFLKSSLFSSLPFFLPSEKRTAGCIRPNSLLCCLLALGLSDK